jgi:hypothetical protein
MSLSDPAILPEDKIVEIDPSVIALYKDEVEKLTGAAGWAFIEHSDIPYGVKNTMKGKLATITYWKEQGPRGEEYPDYYMELSLQNGAKAVRHYDGTLWDPALDLKRWVEALRQKPKPREELNTSEEDMYFSMKPSVLRWLSKAISDVCDNCRCAANRYDGGYTECDLGRPCYAKDAKAFLEKFPQD